MSMKVIALILFAATYILLLLFPKIRAAIALASASIFILLGIVPLREAFFIVDWNVILMIAGTMGIVSLFIQSKMPALLGDLIIDAVPDVKWAIIFLSLFAGLISAFVDNVATVLMIAPVALTISKKLKLNPVPIIISIAISSNLQGAATLVGDTTSILLGGQASMDFLDFFIFHGKMGLFWIVQISALSSALVLLFIFRKQSQKIHIDEREKVTDYFPSVLLLGTIIILIFASFIPADKKPAITNGLICTSLLILGLLREWGKTKSLAVVKETLKEIDLFTLLLLSGLFLVVGGITKAGVIEDISAFFVSIGNDNVFVIYTIIVWFSVILSAFIDNIPYVATMLPVAASIAAIMDIPPYLLYFGLISGATLGGNLTPIGASANITAIGILQKDGYEVKASDFMKISVPFTLVAVFMGYVLIWFIWK